MKKHFLYFLLFFGAVAGSAQTKKIFIDTHVSGSSMKFSLFKKQVDSSFLLMKQGTSTYQYTFDTLSAGIYRVLVDIAYNKYLPTWHPLKPLWENAGDINLTIADSFACTQGMLANPTMVGPGTIAGTLTEGLLKTAGDPMKQVRVVLLNGSNQFVTMSSSNDSGKFSISNLPNGTYKVRTDVVNTTDPNPKTVVIDSAHTSVLVTLTVNKSGTVYTKIQNFQNNSHSTLTVFPNPASDFLMIHFEKTGAQFFVYNLTGKEMLKGKTVDTDTRIELGQLPAGIYFIKVEGNLKKFIVH